MKARELFRLAHQENPRLQWNGCLAAKAEERAMWMVRNGNFGHRDRRTGTNPAWGMVESCLDSRYMGENLTRGHVSASALHETLMASPSHKENILNGTYHHLGVGCHREICVQLFAGD